MSENSMDSLNDALETSHIPEDTPEEEEEEHDKSDEKDE